MSAVTSPDADDRKVAAAGPGPAAVVVGLDCLTGLQTARLLHDRGISVVGVAGNRRHFGARTNACVEVIEADTSGTELVDCLQSLGRRMRRAAVLFPCTDPSVAVLSAHRAELGQWFRLPLARHDLVEMLMNKRRFLEYAQARGLPVPRSIVLSTRADAADAARRLAFPCVVKPPEKSPEWTQRTAAKGFSVASGQELLDLYDRVGDWVDELLVQEWVDGGEDGLVSCNAYFDTDGKPLVTFVARKIRQWPPGIGTSASGVECRDDDVLRETVNLFRELGYQGLAYLEMKRDGKDGRLVIIEANVGRPTGRSAIAEAGGVELLCTAYCDAAGLPLPGARQQRYVGARWIDDRRDLQAAVAAFRRRELTPVEWLRFRRGATAHAIWSRRDPAPFLADLQDVASKGVVWGARLVRPLGPRRTSRRPGDHPRAAEDAVT